MSANTSAVVLAQNCYGQLALADAVDSELAWICVIVRQLGRWVCKYDKLSAIGMMLLPRPVGC